MPGDAFEKLPRQRQPLHDAPWNKNAPTGSEKVYGNVFLAVTPDLHLSA
jgi:hypothetical protein